MAFEFSLDPFNEVFDFGLLRREWLVWDIDEDRRGVGEADSLRGV